MCSTDGSREYGVRGGDREYGVFVIINKSNKRIH